MPSEVTWARDQGHLLYDAADRYTKPGMAWVSHIGADYTARYCSVMRVTPRDAPRTDVGAELDEALSSEVIEIEL
jgi:hypothetical protein